MSSTGITSHKVPVVFVDRDGTIIEDAGYPSDPSKIELLPNVAECLVKLKKLGFRLALISNQSGVGRGYFTVEQMWAFHMDFAELLENQGVSFDAVRYCVAAPWEHDQHRKPNPGMILSAADELNADLKKSIMIGDKISDVYAGRAAGCESILFNASTNSEECEIVGTACFDCWNNVLEYVQSRQWF